MISLSCLHIRLMAHLIIIISKIVMFKCVSQQTKLFILKQQYATLNYNLTGIHLLKTPDAMNDYTITRESKSHSSKYIIHVNLRSMDFRI